MNRVLPLVSKITIFPIKSLDGVSLQKAMISAGGCLVHDREYAIFNKLGKFVNGKSTPLVHSLRSEFDLDNNIVAFRRNEETVWKKFDLLNENNKIASYLSDHFKIPVTFLQNSTGRFLDIPDISGITVLSTASLDVVSNWFDDLSVEESRKRFRATIELEGVEAFWEDHLFTSDGKSIEFLIGDVTVFGISPRARCVVPTRNTISGEVTKAFPKTFAKQRAAALPEFSLLEEYGHNYYLSVDCYIPDSETGKYINTGDAVKIIGEKESPF